MYCAECGAAIHEGDARCAACGQPAGAAAEVVRYAAVIRRLGLWFLLFAALNLGLGAAGLVTGFAQRVPSYQVFEPWPHLPWLAWTYIGGAAWVMLAVRVLLALLAGAAFRVHAPGGRTLGVLAAAAAVTEFPIGLVFGAYTLVRLLGRQNAQLYARITGVRTRSPGVAAH